MVVRRCIGLVAMIELAAFAACSGHEDHTDPSLDGGQPDAIDAAPFDSFDARTQSDVARNTGHAETGGGASDAADATIEPNIVFVTSTKRAPSALGGLVAADALCNESAQDAGLAGTYVAWLSTSQVDARTRLGSATGWVRPDGLPFTSTLGPGGARIAYPPRLDEHGARVPDDEVVVTGTNYGGEYAGSSCADWTQDDLGGTAGGYAAGGTGAWTNAAGRSCTTPSRVYCFGVDRASTVTITPASGRIAFVSMALVDPSSGIAGADDVCKTEAQAAGLAGTFKALLATNTASAASRFSTGLGTAPWVRPDGVPLATTAAAFMAGDLLASPNVSAANTTYESYRLWIGAPFDADAGTAAETCSSWSSNSAADTAAVGETARASPHVIRAGTSTCDFPTARILCLQQ